MFWERNLLLPTEMSFEVPSNHTHPTPVNILQFTESVLVFDMAHMSKCPHFPAVQESDAASISPIALHRAFHNCKAHFCFLPLQAFFVHCWPNNVDNPF